MSIHIVHNVVSIAVMSLGATQCTKLGYDSTQSNNVIARHVCVCVCVCVCACVHACVCAHVQT